ncbi:MAG TPA: phosphatase PAP2 family protein, partial [Mucilaginibacter sp.]|nr:phosphatase PAP2 family protein [Mucilaginibacter sp.]
SIATTTGIFRVYNRDHWFSDVVAGAGFGILSTKAAYLIYPTIRNWLTHGDEKAREHSSKKKSRYQNTMIEPMFQDGAFGLAFSTNF